MASGTLFRKPLERCAISGRGVGGLIVGIAMVVGEGIGQERARGKELELSELLRHPARVTAEIITKTGCSLGRYEALPVWRVIAPFVDGIPRTTQQTMVLVFTAADGSQTVLSMAEVMPPVPLPPLLLLRRVEGGIGDTVRVPVRGGRVDISLVEQAVAPAVRLRYRLQAVLPREPEFRFPVLVVGADVEPLRWLPSVVRVDIVEPFQGQAR